MTSEEEVRSVSQVIPHLDQTPKMPRRQDRGIGIVGAGGIVNYAHLPAYKKAGFKVVAITDQNLDKAEATARAHGIPRICATVDELVRDAEVEIVDVAVYPQEQLTIVEKATAARKHLLCQKPFSDDYAKAVRQVELARQAGMKIAVNQQMRWDAGIRCAKQLIDQGWLGVPTYGAIQVHCLTDWSLWPWIAHGGRVEVMFHSIHYIDALCFLFGQPDYVFTSGSHDPGEAIAAETKTITIWEYTSGLQVLIDVSHSTWQDDRYALFRLEGSEGVIKGTIGLMYNYPQGRPDTLEFMSKRNAGFWFSARLDALWIPDAFIGPMASLMSAIEDDTEPETSGEDNLRTLRVVFAEYRSMAEKRAVRPHDITA